MLLVFSDSRRAARACGGVEKYKSKKQLELTPIGRVFGGRLAKLHVRHFLPPKKTSSLFPPLTVTMIELQNRRERGGQWGWEQWWGLDGYFCFEAKS